MLRCPFMSEFIQITDSCSESRYHWVSSSTREITRSHLSCFGSNGSVELGQKVTYTHAIQPSKTWRMEGRCWRIYHKTVLLSYPLNHATIIIVLFAGILEMACWRWSAHCRLILPLLSMVDQSVTSIVSIHIVMKVTLLPTSFCMELPEEEVSSIED